MWKRFFLLFAAFHYFICAYADPRKEFATPASLANIEGGTSSFVHGCVNAITGDYVESEVDLFIPGVDPLVLRRTYCSSDEEFGYPANGWSLNHRGYLNVEEDVYDFCDHEGTKSRFLEEEVTFGKWPKLAIDKRLFACGLTNCAWGELSGRTNVKNTRIRGGGNRAYAVDGAGTRYRFTKYIDIYEIRRISEITLPSLNRIHYSYNFHKDSDPDLTKIKLVNRAGTTVAKIACAELKPDFRGRHFRFTSEDGRELNYKQYKRRKGQKYCLEVTSNFSIPQKFQYEKDKVEGEEFGKILRKEYPEKRFRRIEYYTKEKYLEGRVKTIYEPAGATSAPVVAARFIYELDRASPYERKRKGKTHVFDALGHETIFAFNNEERLSSIVRYAGIEVHSKERFKWGSKKTADHANLLSRTFANAQGVVLARRRFSYDAKGNVIRDSLSGNLCGKGTQEDRYEVEATYTKDGRNLITSETKGNYLLVYGYFPDSDRMQYKFILANGKICQRNFYAYDDNGAVISEIEDNGTSSDQNDLSGVTERRIKQIKNTLMNPCGLPEVIVEKYLDLPAQREMLLRSTIQKYDPQGHLLAREVYGSDQVLAAAMHWEYDAHGNIIKEIDALGQIKIKKYDANNNLIYEQGPSSAFHLEYEYDFMNRLITRTTVGNDRMRFVERYRYDLLGNKVAEADIYGNEIQYAYDPFGHAIQERFSPIATDIDCSAQLIMTYAYDLFGNRCSEESSAGGIIKKEYNIRGKPCCIEYLDGTIERFQYNPNGDLYAALSRNNVLTLYTYDYLSRPTQIETLTTAGESLSIVHKTYDAFHLLTETDPMGHVTEYTYDGAGRKVGMRKGSQKVAYVYDLMGRLTETRNYVDDVRYRAKKQGYDALDRIVEEKTEDDQGNTASWIQYQYDPAGNCTHTYVKNHTSTAITTKKYNIFNELVEITDALGNCIHTSYDYQYINALNQRVPCIRITDPLGCTTCTIKNARGLPETIERTNPLGEVIQKSMLFYDPAGRLTHKIDAGMIEGKPTQCVATHWKYDAAGRVISLIEADGTPQCKESRYTYNAFGQKESDIRPDGTQLHYLYDSFGRVEERKSSDGTIHEHYTYNVNHQVVEIADRVHAYTLLKEYDAQGMMTSEIFNREHQITAAYDGLGRILSLMYPDGSQAAYQYDPFHLQSIHRVDQKGEERYAHRYSGYDLFGNITSGQMIGQAGTQEIQYDILGRVAAISTAAWRETIDQYDAVGNLLEMTANGQSRKYTYDDLYQLNSEEGHVYQYDSLYNRVAKDGANHRVNVLNQVEEDALWHYDYDRNGRMICRRNGDEMHTYGYDALDRLTSFTKGEEQTRYFYDAENRRYKKQHYINREGEWILDHTEKYLYHHHDEIGMCGATGKIVELRVLGIGKGAEIGAATAMEIGGELFAPVHDHNGNVMCLIDAATGEAADTYRYTAFGEREEDSCNVQNPWGYASKRIDPENGLIYFGRRYYDPAAGRWLTPDPIGFDSGPNLYAYVLNSPLTHCDLYGLEEAFLDRVKGAVRSIVHKVGQVVEWVGENICFIPYARDVMAAVGHAMRGESFTGYFKTLNPKSKIIPSDKSNNSKVCIIVVNGMNTSLAEAKELSNFISDIYNFPVDLVYSSSHGLVMDKLQVLALKLGISTHGVKILLKHIKKKIDDFGGTESGGRILVKGYSRGGLIVDRALSCLTPEQEAMIEVETYGSAALINDKNLKSVTNYVSICDPIPFLLGCISMLINNSSIKFLPSHAYPFTDHNIRGATYLKAIRNSAERFNAGL